MEGTSDKAKKEKKKSYSGIYQMNIMKTFIKIIFVNYSKSEAQMTSGLAGMGKRFELTSQLN